MIVKYDAVIGIDPDRYKSGIGVLDVKSRQLDIGNAEFPELIEKLKETRIMIPNSLVVVEAGWMVKKSNYHDAQGHRAEKIAKDVGANHETGRKIVEMCKYYGINVIEQHPLPKMWKGLDGKITHDELVAVTGLKKKHSNQDARDAGLLAWVCAGLPIRVNPKR